jgi:CheY-like chemotaxis protein
MPTFGLIILIYPMSSPTTILLVEDDQDDQDLFMTALSGIRDVTLFAIAINGKEAIDWLRTSLSQPAVIFMDINMPVMDGMECLSEIAKDPLINSIPVVILSSDIHQRERAQQLGAVAFIEKPNSTLILQQELENIIARL